MSFSRDMTTAPEEEEHLVYFTTEGGESVVLARLHWFPDGEDQRRQAWQSTWDGSEIPKEWAPYAWATVQPLHPEEIL